MRRLVVSLDCSLFRFNRLIGSSDIPFDLLNVMPFLTSLTERVLEER